MKFLTEYDRRHRVDRDYSNPGERFRPLYRPVVSEDGTLDVVEDGKTDLYEYIQSHAESVDINTILSRYINGEDYMLNQRPVQYLDTTEMPKTYAEMLNLMIEARAGFEKLPLDQRAAFDHSFERYMATAGTPEWLQALGISQPAIVEQKEVTPDAE